MIANILGTVALCSTPILKDVLCIPKLKCKLISIPELNRENFPYVMLTKRICLILDCTIRSLIRVGEERDQLIAGSFNLA